MLFYPHEMAGGTLRPIRRPASAWIERAYPAGAYGASTFVEIEPLFANEISLHT